VASHNFRINICCHLGDCVTNGLDFLTYWQAILSHIERLERCAPRHRLIGNWGDQNDIVVSVESPASETELVAAEVQMAEAIPAPLRQLFAEGTRAMTVMWSWPGALVEQPGGWMEVELDNRPAFAPAPSGGYLSWSLDGLVALHAEWKQACQDLGVRIKTDPEEADWHAYHQRFWQRAFPFMYSSNGDVIAVDRASSDGELLLLNHEGDAPPGWFLGLGPLAFLDQFGRLGFPDVDLGTFTDFASETPHVSTSTVENFNDGIDPDWLPTLHRIDASCAAGKRWSEFFFGASH
jgi:cell wall assembly regulator SMI1